MSVFTDRAQVVSKVRGAQVDGRFLETEVLSPVFRCRYTPQQESESRDAGGIRRVRPATMTTRPRDVTGAPVALNPAAVVQIESPTYGTFRMEIVGAPRAARARRAIKSYTATLQRVSRA